MFDSVTQANLDEWLNGFYDEATKSWIRKQLKDNPKGLVDAFYTSLSFGTGGLRALMGVGPNRLNIFTIMMATQSLANYIHQQPGPKEHSVFIGYDCRHHSKLFAETAAQVLAGNGIKSYVCKDIRPTPLISFGCRWKHCTAAIMITASHNPPEYNGYKIYWSDGGQIVSPHDQAIQKEMKNCSRLEQVKKISQKNHPLIEWMGDELDEAYLKANSPYSFYPKQNHEFGIQLHIVYTNLHGTGMTLMPSMLNSWGFKNFEFVPEQMEPDPNFSTVSSPNPEDLKALALGINQMKNSKADILIATDPDADRLGVAVLHKGHVEILNGNQIACLCLHHICEAYSKQNRWPDRAAFIKTLPTTELFAAIADHYKRPCFNVLTGFKYIGEKIYLWENDPNGFNYIFGGEESFGYLLGTQARDKDAILSAALICEVALNAKLQGKTLIDSLNDLYCKYGVYQEHLHTIHFPDTKQGKEQMVTHMQQLRKSPPTHLLNTPIILWEDYLTSIGTHLPSGDKKSIPFPRTDMLLIKLEDDSKLILRPSGTESKIKLYGGVKVKMESGISLDEALSHSKKLAQQKVNSLLNEVAKLFDAPC